MARAGGTSYSLGRHGETQGSLEVTLDRPGATLGRHMNNESYYSTKDMERSWEDHWRILEYLRTLWVIPGRLGETMERPKRLW